MLDLVFYLVIFNHRGLIATLDGALPRFSYRICYDELARLRASPEHYLQAMLERFSEQLKLADLEIYDIKLDAKYLYLRGSTMANTDIKRYVFTHVNMLPSSCYDICMKAIKIEQKLDFSDISSLFISE